MLRFGLQLQPAIARAELGDEVHQVMLLALKYFIRTLRYAFQRPDASSCLSAIALAPISCDELRHWLCAANASCTGVISLTWHRELHGWGGLAIALVVVVAEAAEGKEITHGLRLLDVGATEAQQRTATSCDTQ